LVVQPNGGNAAHRPGRLDRVAEDAPNRFHGRSRAALAAIGEGRSSAAFLIGPRLYDSGRVDSDRAKTGSTLQRNARFFGMVICVLAVITGGTFARSAPPTSADVPQVHEKRPIELPGTRIISLSPDGRLLAASMPADSPRGGQLCVYAVDGLAQQSCTDLSGLDAGLSPDSRRLAFAEQAFNLLRDGDLWVMDAATGNLTNLTDDGARGRLPVSGRAPKFPEYLVDVSPAWSVDGRSLAFSRSTWRDGAWQGNEIDVVSADGGTPERLLAVSPDKPGVVTGKIASSPDGKGLYYAVIHAETDENADGVWVVDRATGATRRVVGPNPGSRPRTLDGVSPRGDRLLVAHQGADSQFQPPEAYDDVVDLATGAVTLLTVEVPDAVENSRAHLATFSPDGASILFVTLASGLAGTEAVVRDVASGAQTPLVAGLPEPSSLYIGQTTQWATNGSVYVPGDEAGHGTLLLLGGTAAAVATPGTSVATAGTPDVTLNLVDLAFDPNQITIPAHQDVTIQLIAKGVAGHNFNIDQLNIHSPTLLYKDTTTITINAPAGTYQYDCSVFGHKAAGMVGTLTVR
jgi:Tol biopolymer transport system component